MRKLLALGLCLLFALPAAAQFPAKPLRTVVEGQGFVRKGSTPEELARFHKSQWDAWTKTVREQGIRFE